MIRIIAALAIVAFGIQSAVALDPPAQRGFVFARTNCAMCHAIGPFGASPLPVAPPFRTLHERGLMEDLKQRLAEGIVAKHPSMPQFTLDPGQVDDLIAYLKSLE
jgi:cytochrome c